MVIGVMSFAVAARLHNFLKEQFEKGVPRIGGDVPILPAAFGLLRSNQYLYAASKGSNTDISDIMEMLIMNTVNVKVLANEKLLKF
jgi:hypothetical protein